VGAFPVHVRPPVAQGTDELSETRPLAALDQVLVQAAQHLEGRLVVHQLRIIQCPHEDRDPAVAGLGFKFLPDRVPPFFQDGSRPGRRRGR
jgi:hypothetical protein